MWPFRKRFVHVVLVRTEHGFEESAWYKEASDRLASIEKVVNYAGSAFRRHYNIVAFPGGWFYGPRLLSEQLAPLSSDLHSVLNSHKRCCVLFGVDSVSHEGRSEFAVAVSHAGVLGAAGPLTERPEDSRSFEFSGYRVCLFACNERTTTIRRAELASLKSSNITFVLVHGFTQQGPLKSSSYYSRYVLADMSEGLGSPVFAPAAFFGGRSVGIWPAGVFSSEKPKNRRKRKTREIRIAHQYAKELEIPGIGTAEVRTFDLAQFR